MNRIIKSITLFLTVTLLSSCIYNGNKRVILEEETVTLYSFVNPQNESKILGDYAINEIKVTHIEDQDYMPYVNLETFSSLFDSILRKGYKSVIARTSDTWTIRDNNNKGIFRLFLDYYGKYVTYSGDASSAFISTDDYSNASLYLGVRMSQSVLIYPGEEIVTLSYSDSGYNTYTINNITYIPLSLMDTIFSSLSGFHVFYNYKDIYLYGDEEWLWNKNYYSDVSLTSEVGPKADMKDVINNELHRVMPLYLREERLHNIYFAFDNLYGLKQTRNISSMKQYIIDKGYDKGMLSENNDVRNEATHKFFAELDDGHTRLTEHVNTKDLWGNQDDNYPYFGQLWLDRIALRANLISQRNALYSSKGSSVGKVIYSNDDSTAFISFDGFSVCYDALDSQRNIKDEVYTEDTFFFLAKSLEEIKNSGKNVQNVILDIACNGGGIIGVLMKLVTLLSKDNNSSTMMYRDDIGALLLYRTLVDSNLDGRYDEDDVYGDDFNFYILQSEFSFSCGNAFPFFLEKNNLATMIGQKSGGGECSVVTNTLPSGESYRHSSKTHIVWYEGMTIQGDEAGVTPTYEVEYNDFYDLEKLVTAINQSI
ncbi:MAG: hypothetical protein IJQ67_04870 [Bacilli bacterium]|nr:hypothetical protein [Bacilli bacterium]